MFEHADAIPVECDDLAVEDGILYGQFSKRFAESFETLEHILIARDQAAFTRSDIRNASKAVVF